jgi:hypothetical protein
MNVVPFIRTECKGSARVAYEVSGARSGME